MLNVIKKNKNYKFYYYYFNTKKTGIPYEDLECPIIFSISTLRWWEKNAQIFVIDCSPNFLDWGIFPDLLNFTVIRKPLNFDCNCQNYIELYKGLNIDINVNKFLLSKPSIIYSTVLDTSDCRDIIIVCDSDIFFLKNPMPLSTDCFSGLCCKRTNTGYYYFANGGNGVDDIFESWCSVCDSCMNNPILQKAVAKNYFFKMFDRLKEKNFKQLGIQEEVVWLYIQEKNKKLNIKSIPSWENFFFGFLTKEKLNFYKIKNIHLCIHNKNTIINRQNKGLFCLCVKELRDMVCDTIGKHTPNIVNNSGCGIFSIQNNKKMEKFLND